MPRSDAGSADVEVFAAGAVLWRTRSAGAVEIAVIHRPRYDDWTLPKGKLEPGESMAAAAVREIEEETGVAARLGPFLCDVRYTDAGGRSKLVRYWSAEACRDAGFDPNDEVDGLRWVHPDAARDLLTYPHDHDVVARFVELGPPTSLLVLVRHAKAGRRADWDGEDGLRPLSNAGRKQAQDLVGLLRLFGPDRIASAPPRRCRDTVAPLADSLGLPVVEEPLLGEALHVDDPDATLARVRELAALPGVSVVCSQGGVIPDVVTALTRDAARKVDVGDAPSKKASTWVLGLCDGALVSADYVEHPRG